MNNNHLNGPYWSNLSTRNRTPRALVPRPHSTPLVESSTIKLERAHPSITPVPLNVPTATKSVPYVQPSQPEIFQPIPIKSTVSLTTDLPVSSTTSGSLRSTNAQYYQSHSIATQTLVPLPPTCTYEPGSPTNSMYSQTSRSAFDPVVHMPNVQLSPTSATNLLPN
jgi:hypothetical protein